MGKGIPWSSTLVANRAVVEHAIQISNGYTTGHRPEDPRTCWSCGCRCVDVDLLMKYYSGLPFTGARLVDHTQPGIAPGGGMWAESSQSPNNIWPQKVEEDILVLDIDRAARSLLPLRTASTVKVGALLVLLTCLCLTSRTPSYL